MKINKGIDEAIEDLQKDINNSSSEHSKKVEIRIIELNNIHKILETKIVEKENIINDYMKEIDALEVNLQNFKDQKL